MKIIFIISSSIGGGAQILLANLAESVAKNNDVMIVCPHGYLEEKLKSLGFLPYISEVNRKSMITIRKRILEWVDGEECVINPFLFGTAYYSCRAFKDVSNCKVFSLLLNPIIRKDLFFLKKIAYRYIAKQIGKYSDGIGVGSPELSNEVQQLMHRTPVYLENRVPNVVPPKSVFYDGKRPMKVCFVGRMAKQKRPDLFVQTAKITKRERANIKYYMVGEGPMKTDVEKYIKDNSLEDTVKLAGFINELYPFLLDMDILLSSAEFENTPLIVLNAMNASLPVVTGNVVGVPHLICNGVDGIVTDDYTAESFAATLIDLSVNPNKVENLSMASYKKAITEYSFELFSKAYVDALSKI